MKKELRKKAKELRKTFDIENFSQKLTKLIQENEYYKNSKNVLLYYPLRFEMNFLGLLNDEKNFYFPRVDGESMLVCPYSNGDKLEKSTFGIYEPCSNPCDGEIIDLAIVPALLVDCKGNRLGYGGGFYDRFLGKYKNIKTICALPANLVVDEIPTEDFDIPVDVVIKAF